MRNYVDPPAWGGSLPEPYKRLDAAVVFPPRLTRVKPSSAVSREAGVGLRSAPPGQLGGAGLEV